MIDVLLVTWCWWSSEAFQVINTFSAFFDVFLPLINIFLRHGQIAEDLQHSKRFRNWNFIPQTKFNGTALLKKFRHCKKSFFDDCILAFEFIFSLYYSHKSHKKNSTTLQIFGTNLLRRFTIFFKLQKVKHKRLINAILICSIVIIKWHRRLRNYEKV